MGKYVILCGVVVSICEHMYIANILHASNIPATKNDQYLKSKVTFIICK